MNMMELKTQTNEVNPFMTETDRIVPKIEKVVHKSYKAKISYNEYITSGLYFLYIEWLKYLYTNKDSDFTDIVFLSDNHFVSYFNHDKFGFYTIIFDYLDTKFLLTIEKFKNGNETIYNISCQSKDAILLSEQEIHNVLFKKVIENSILKGKIIDLIDLSNFEYSILNFSNHTFDTLYLPEFLEKDLKNYVEVFSKYKKAFRYLFAGSPGTGKTESLLTIGNILNQDGVTIIKGHINENLPNTMSIAEILAPSIVYFDDLDLYLGNRNDGSYSKELGLFLDILDGVKKLQNNVGILATTNSLSFLDLAVSRPGRFNKIMFFGTITKENIKNIIIKCFNKKIKEIETELISLDYEKLERIKSDLVSNKLIDYYFDKKLSGAYIYNITETLFFNIMNESHDRLEYNLLEYVKMDNDLLTEALKKNMLEKDIVEIKNNKKFGFNNQI